MASGKQRKHRVSVVCEGVQIFDWTNYTISSSMIEPSDAFSMSTPWRQDVWNILRRDARVKVLIDSTVILDGFVDRRRKSTRDDSIEVSGRDRAGRLVQESAESINYEGMKMLEAVRRLASPWFTTVTISDARNRSLRRGKGRRVPAGDEPLVVNLPVPRRGRVHPGMTRWAIIEDIVTQAGLIAWSSADGKEIFVGKPNYSQAPQFLVQHVRPPGSMTRSSCISLDLVEDNGDRFSLIAVVGTGSGDDANYGANVTSRSGRALDYDSEDGTGRDFLYPKRLLMPEAQFDSNGDARRVAEREQARRDFRRTSSTAVMEGHGQFIGTAAPTIFAPNTIARVIDEDFFPVYDENFIVHTCSYEGDREGAEKTTLEMVPSGTEIVL